MQKVSHSLLRFLAACSIACPAIQVAAAEVNSSSVTVSNISPVVLSQKPAELPAPVTPANQLKGFYLTGALGGNWPQQVNVEELTNNFGESYGFKDFSYSGVSGEVGIGYDFGSLRAELTYAYDGSSLKNYTDLEGSFDYINGGGGISKNTIIASGYWDIDTKSRFIPYLGGGVGYSNLRVGQSEDLLFFYPEYRANSFAYQAKAGLSYLVNRRSEAFVEAVYRGMAGFNVNPVEGLTYRYGNYNSWGFQLGARVRFGQ